MSGRKTVYLSGPISLGGTSTAEELTDFLGAFRRHARRLRSHGYHVIDPAELDLAEGAPWETYMRHAMHAVADADIVATLPRWSESRGAALEVFVATQLKIPVLPVEELP